MKHKQIRLVALVGMSGSGKDTIKNLLVNDGYKELEIFTTRPKRSDDESGYDFISYEEYLEKMENGIVLESREYQIETTGETWYYGTYMPDMSHAKDNDKYVVVGTVDSIKVIKEILGKKASKNDIIIRFIPLILDLSYHERLKRILNRSNKSNYTKEEILKVLEREQKDELLLKDTKSLGLCNRILIDPNQSLKQVYENVKYAIDYDFQTQCDHLF